MPQPGSRLVPHPRTQIPSHSASAHVYISRHGQTASNLLGRYAGREPEGLTPEGRDEVTRVALTLREIGLGAIWTSCIERARETASLLATTLDITVRDEPLLDEMLLGPWEGLTEQEINARYPREFSTWNTQPDLLKLPGRETLHQVAKRINPVVQRASTSNKPVLLVTHVALIRVLVLSVLEIDLSAYKRVAVPNASCFRVDAGSGEVVRLSSLESVTRELSVTLDLADSNTAGAPRRC